MAAKSATTVRLMLAAIAVCGVVAAITVAAAQSPTAAQPDTAPPAEAKYSGCVVPLEADKDILVINTATVCAKLTGKFTAADVAGHEVDLSGVLTAGTSTTPASISVNSVTNVGKSCSSSCALLPPRKRGLGKGGQLPGKEGGTPGAAPQH